MFSELCMLKYSFLVNLVLIKKIERKKPINFIWNHKRPRMFKEILRKKNNTGGITVSDFRLYYKTIAIKLVWHPYKTDT